MHRKKYVPYTGGLVSDRIVTIEVQPSEILSPPQRAATDLDRVHAIQPFVHATLACVRHNDEPMSSWAWAIRWKQRAAAEKRKVANLQLIESALVGEQQHLVGKMVGDAAQ